jgi:hypothetical protein
LGRFASIFDKGVNMGATERLTQIGFTKVGQWTVKFSKPCCSLDEVVSATDVLYAFAGGLVRPGGDAAAPDVTRWDQVVAIYRLLAGTFSPAAGEAT